MKTKKVIIASLIIISFFLLIASVVFFINEVREQRRLDPLELESMTKEQIIQTIYDKHQNEGTPFYYFIPLFGFFGVAVGASIYFILNSNLEQKDKVIKYNTDLILTLLNPEEKRVILKIVENNGKIQQIEITYMDGYTKVKSHRIIESLVQKNLITKEAMGKMRMLKLNSDLYEILKKK